MGYSKSSLAIALSKLQVFPSPKPKLEQYPTDPEIAAEVLWNAYMLGDIKGRTIADLGCGTGILGIGAILLGAKKAYFIEKDASAVNVLKSNLKDAGQAIGRRAEVVESDMTLFDEKVDLVLQNPPFGTREKHADRQFLEKAFSVSSTVYSFHKTSTRRFVQSFSEESGFTITNRFDFDFPLKQTLAHHKSRIRRIAVSCFRLERRD